MKEDINNHKFIQILKYAYENDTFTEKDMCDSLSLSSSEFQRYVVGIASHDPNSAATGQQRWKMNYDAFLNYLEYIEWSDARKASKEAKCLSIIAISISGILAIISIVLSIYQMNHVSSVSLEESQYNHIGEIAIRSENIQNSIDALDKDLSGYNSEHLQKIKEELNESQKIIILHLENLYKIAHSKKDKPLSQAAEPLGGQPPTSPQH